MIKQHFGLICLSIAIVIASLVYLFSTRYQVITPSTSTSSRT